MLSELTFLATKEEKLTDSSFISAVAIRIYLA